jgi:Zn-dependent M16 (insulinase) family peptidase
MTFFTTADPKEWERVIRFTFQVFLFTVFEKERIVTIAKNLITNIVDIKRDGHSVLSAVQSRVSLSKEQSQKEGSNEFHISIFKQEKFLAQVLKDCENDPEKVINNLGLIRDHIISQSLNDNTPSFMRIGVPLKFSINQSKKSSMSDLSNDLLRIWNGELQKLSPEIQKRKRKDYKYLGSPFPYPRSSFQRDHMDLKFSENIMVSVGGLQTYYLSQSVECDLLITPKHPDYFPTLLLSEILTRAEGPLYTGIRGQGFAYGANMYCYLWAGQLSFELYQSSEPQKALQVFYDLLEKLGIDFDVLCSDYEIETAQASVAYRWAADSSTACTIMSTALRSSLQGFTDLDDCFGFVNVMYQVKRSDLKRVFEKYFRKFLGNEKNTVVVTPMGKMEDATKSFLDYNLEFKSYQLKDFDI